MPHKKPEKIISQKNIEIKDAAYYAILKDVREILRRGTSVAHKAVDQLKVFTYWKVGERIVRGELQNRDRANYRTSLVVNISKDLGYSRYEVTRMMDFYRHYPIVAEVPQQLSWAHFRELLPLDQERLVFYQCQAINEKWSSPQLRQAIRRKLFENVKGAKRSLPVRKLPVLPSCEEIFKGNYQFNFLDLSGEFSERQLEDALLDRTVKVLTELGRNFSLAGRQVKILVDGHWDKIDLVFYHTRLHCYILVELKKGKFRKDYVGQINAYIEYYRHNEETKDDKPSIGLILCEDVGYEEAVYALGGLEEKIFIAKYRLELPSEKQIKDGMKRLERE